jgi:O-methyltransferase domain
MLRWIGDSASAVTGSLREIIMDMTPVCRVAEEYIQAAGLARRFTTAAGDLVGKSYPKDADVIMLGHVLHDW